MPSSDASAEVFGHYIQRNGSWEPLLSESSALFVHVVEDNISLVEKELESNGARLNQLHHILYWGSAPNGSSELATQQGSEAKTSVSVKFRSLLHLGCYHGSLRVVSYLLSKGADARLKSPGDGKTAHDVSRLEKGLLDPALKINATLASV